MSATVKETAAALRKNLHATFPGTKFSVRMATGTAYGWIDVRWTDGPTSEQVNAVTREYESERFDGMDDSYHLTGITEWSSRGVNTHRKISDERVQAALLLVEYTVDGEPLIDTPDQVYGIRYPGETDMDVARRYCMATSA